MAYSDNPRFHARRSGLGRSVDTPGSQANQTQKNSDRTKRISHIELTMRQQNETQIAFLGDRREFAREVAADVLNEIRTLYTLEPAMNVQQAAAFLGVSEQQVRELAEAGKIPAFDTSTKGTARQWRFWKHQLALVGAPK